MAFNGCYGVAVMGHGVVGSGVCEILYHKKDLLTQKSGKTPVLKRILDLRKFPEAPYAPLFTDDFSLIEKDPEIAVVAEAMGGLKPAYEYVKRCLLAGKSVVTSNKELVAAKGAELLEIAAEKGVSFLFEASVGGGIPVIHPVCRCMAANQITEIAGILNGTTNFILSKMIYEHTSFEQALATAQELGYAERDPAADVDGHDACRKICILASLMLGKEVSPTEVEPQGIRDISLADVSYAGAYGSVIKLIGRAKLLENGKAAVTVSPALVPKSGRLAGIDGVFNGVVVRGDEVGELLFFGRGAGKEATASAVVSDIVEAAGQDGNPYLFWKGGCGNVDTTGADQMAYYFRTERSELLPGLAQELFGEVCFLSGEDTPEDQMAFVTGVMEEKKLLAGADTLAKKLPVYAALRVLDY